MFSKDPFGKFNLLVTLAMVFVIMIFSFFFYYLVRITERKKVNEGVLDFTHYSSKSFAF